MFRSKLNFVPWILELIVAKLAPQTKKKWIMNVTKLVYTFLQIFISIFFWFVRFQFVPVQFNIFNVHNNLILTLMSFFFFFFLLRLLRSNGEKRENLLYKTRENNLRFKWSGKMGLIESSLDFIRRVKIAPNFPNRKKNNKIVRNDFDLIW